MSDLLIVATSTVADGSMYNRHNPSDQDVIHNRKTFLKHLNIPFESTTRVNPDTLERATIKHETNWCHYVQVDSSSPSGMEDNEVIACDALITTQPGHALFLPVADCVGTVLCDPTKHLLMVAHLGRHSLEQNGGFKSVQFLVDTYGSKAADIRVWLTPAPGQQAFPIWALDNRGMKEVMFEQLQTAGIKRENITDNPADTSTDKTYFSYSEFLKGNRAIDGDHAIVAMMQ